MRPDLSPYTFRRTYAHWLELAQIPRSRRKQYMGHSTGDQTGDYEVSEVEEFLADDAGRLKTFIEQARAPSLKRLRQRDYDVL